MQLDLFVQQAIADFTRQPTYSEVAASSSCDRICEGKAREPFSYQGRLHVAASGFHHGRYDEFEAVELIPLRDFKGTPTTYPEKLFGGDDHGDPDRFSLVASRLAGVHRRGDEHGESARSDPNGFYYGIAVNHRQKYVIGRPTAILVFEGEKLIEEIPWSTRVKSERAQRVMKKAAAA